MSPEKIFHDYGMFKTKIRFVLFLDIRNRQQINYG